MKLLESTKSTASTWSTATDESTPRGLDWADIVETTPRDTPRDEEDGRPVTEKDPLVKILRVIEPTKALRHVRTERSVASIFLGKRTEAEKKLFHLAVKQSSLSCCVWVLWWLGACIGLLTLARITPSWCIWASTLMLPLPLVSLLVLSKDLVVECLNEMEYYVVNILNLVVFTCAIRMLGGDERCIFWVCLVPTMAITNLVDAYPQKWRTIFSKLFFSTQVFFLVAWNALLMTGMVKWHKVYYQIGEVRGSLAGCTFTTSLTLLLYFGRHIRVGYTEPNQFVIIKSAVRTFKEEMRLSIDESGPGNLIYVRQKVESQRSKARVSEIPGLRNQAAHYKRQQIMQQANTELSASQSPQQSPQQTPQTTPRDGADASATPEVSHPAPSATPGGLDSVMEVDTPANSPMANSPRGQGRDIRQRDPFQQGVTS